MLIFKQLYFYVEFFKMSKSLVVKANQLVTSKYKLTASEAKIVTLLASVIKKSDDDIKIHRFKAKDLMELTGLGNGNYDDLQLSLIHI